MCLLFAATTREAIDFTCELDEYAQLVQEFKESGLIKDRRKGLIHNYKNSFVGKEAVDWLVKTKKIGKLYYNHCVLLDRKLNAVGVTVTVGIMLE